MARVEEEAIRASSARGGARTWMGRAHRSSEATRGWRERGGKERDVEKYGKEGDIIEKQSQLLVQLVRAEREKRIDVL
jgi:hypothetical protein